MNTKFNHKHVLVLGGYGTFGSLIVRALCQKGFKVTISGRHFHKAQSLKHNIMQQDIHAQVKVSCFDANQQLGVHLNKLKPDLVIHTCGPFQEQNMHIAKTIIKAGIHYIDLSDSREYIKNLLVYDELAVLNGVTAITAASTVPCLSSAVLKHLQQAFKITSFSEVKIGISPGQRTPRGLATTQAVLSYIGKPLKPWPESKGQVYGWGDTYKQKFPHISSRLMSRCEAPDLDLLPEHFPINELSFSAGMESKFLHRLISVLAWLVKLGLPLNPAKHAARLLKQSRWFDVFGTEDGGMHVTINGQNNESVTIEKTWFIEAFKNHGPNIPTIPAIIMANKILTSEYQRGVIACVNQISLTEYLSELEQYEIHTCIE